MSSTSYAKVQLRRGSIVVSNMDHTQLNRSFMTVLFFIPMTVIAFYESTPSKKNWLDDFINGTPLDEDDSLAARDPEVDGEDARNGIVISRSPFSELVKVFPNTHEVSPKICIQFPAEHNHYFSVR